MAHRRAYAAFKAKDYDRAEKMFGRIMERWPRSHMVDHTALNWGFTFYLRKQYVAAIAAFKELVNRYPESPNAAEARYHIGLCQRNLGRRAEAKTTMAELIKGFSRLEMGGAMPKNALGEMKK